MIILLEDKVSKMLVQEKIKKAFISLVIENQSIKIPVKDIVSRAKISRRSFYNYYPDRQAITEDIYIDTIERTIKTCFDKKLTTEIFVTKIYQAFLDNKDFFIIAIKENNQNSLFETIIERNKIVFIHLFKDVIEDQNKLEYLSYKYAATQVMLLKKWLMSGMIESPAFMTEIYLDSHQNYESIHESIINKKTNW